MTTKDTRRDAIDRALELRDQTRVNEAVAILERLLEDNPDNPAALGTLGSMYLYEVNDAERAHPLFVRLVSMSPSSERGSMGLILSSLQLGLDDAAFQELRRFISRQPSSDAHSGLLATNIRYRRPQLLELAAELWLRHHATIKRNLSRDTNANTVPDAPLPELDEEAASKLAEAHDIYLRGDAAAAATIADRLVEAYEDDPGLLAVVAQYHLDAGGLNSAIDLLKKAVQLDPHALPPSRSLVQSYLEAREIDLALKELERYLTEHESQEHEDLLADILVVLPDGGQKKAGRARKLATQLAAELWASKTLEKLETSQD